MRPTSSIWNPVSSKMVFRACRVLASFVWMGHPQLAWVPELWLHSLRVLGMPADMRVSSHQDFSELQSLSRARRKRAGHQRSSPTSVLPEGHWAPKAPNSRLSCRAKNNACSAAVTSIHKSIHDDVSTMDFFFKKIPSFKQNLLYKLLSFYDQVNRCVLLLNFVSWREASWKIGSLL